ncbi:hypothetical protein QR680_018761 [Steinernema hermaphroditum]|uniref:Uncharacterized protein n=1 Tax=Steinernema hermaphroditum TaxID=289476 RepID=A0AA39HJW3_9BILA|nr:hypothetical protein QR680_018761 [Steinernema hermaphroditum]
MMGLPHFPLRKTSRIKICKGSPLEQAIGWLSDLVVCPSACKRISFKRSYPYLPDACLMFSLFLFYGLATHKLWMLSSTLPAPLHLSFLLTLGIGRKLPNDENVAMFQSPKLMGL